MKNSIWSDTTKLHEFQTLSGEKNTDVLIVGGGIAGILCAFFLKERGVNYILAEGSGIASGITKNTTAKITFQHGLIYNKLIEKSGFNKAQMYLNANQKALKKYEKICKDINCDFETKDSYIYSLSDTEKIEAEVNAVNSLGYKADFVTSLPLPFKTNGAIRFKNQSQFNPLMFIKGIYEQLNIYEYTFVRDISAHTATTDNGKINFKKAIICTHFPFINRHGSYFLKLYQHRSYVSAYENCNMFDGMYVDENMKGLSFRNYNNLLLIGGGSHRTGKKGGCWQEINNFAKKHYPKAKLKYEWATQDCMSLDHIPYIGKYSATTPDIYVMTGFNKWGFTSAMAGAEIIADMVMGYKNDLYEVFSPQRSILKSQLAVNGFETATNLLTPAKKRCPHLGCALKWNKAEHSWDCPCHGSRFEKNGTLIDNPATNDLKKDLF